MPEKGIYYFDQWGIENTEKTLQLVKQRAAEIGIHFVIIASNTGATAVKAFEMMGDTLKIVAVGSMYGYKEPGKTLMLEENRFKLSQWGVPMIHTTHAFAGISRSVTRMWGGITPLQLLAQALKIMGEGFKVCIEVSVMAVDTGAIPMDEDVIAVGGTIKGADTAIVLKPAHSNEFFSMRIREIICMPSDRPSRFPPI